MSHARIDQGKDKIDHEVDRNKEKGHQDQISNHDWPVEHANAVNDQLTHTRPGKNSLRYHGKGEGRAQLKPKYSDNGDGNEL